MDIQRHSMCSNQRGETLVGLMIALSLMLFLLGGVLKLYSSASSGYRTVEDGSEVQDNLKFGHYLVAKYVRLAGRLNDPQNGTAIAQPLAGISDSAEENSAEESGVNALCTGVNASTDCLIVRYQNDIGRHCTGVSHSSGSNDEQVVVFSIRLNTQTNLPGLFCDDGTAENRVELVSNVDDMTVRFLEADGTNFRFKTSNEVSDWLSVRGVELALSYVASNSDYKTDYSSQILLRNVQI